MFQRKGVEKGVYTGSLRIKIFLNLRVAGSFPGRKSVGSRLNVCRVVGKVGESWGSDDGSNSDHCLGISAFIEQGNNG